ncbi:2',3'-cyclic-nucleotide 2'-phosphodiesterase / 3'-nucleotidase [Pseudidiomarina planktonica]|uniref:2',3'-cyclic-nucleotide 2'-phosphodiesterase / 3'-nucleotidase n=1 Tax=Pseudidiomarina planktonica TaxID=1323738 RepID=A0A1Y6ESJ3_9GAMM|nr:bifunctional 2',3'-cyclic-nucleotide 2'-phosphodiesterase/3'-nucleotidase [Pseudidiomarina planktonica]RUO65280.1 bifunctional 2',3'-cyclic-nucleotide 2'-phosphodiesterase/3'-nucleotidase [Pseudidiomarina planktonica]SMQ65685.1 2',3'-cyclic-nucleotide 2'-phosphodiesterase / 3'-nucleotidase [Pseudidiomarina planktonica]
MSRFWLVSSVLFLISCQSPTIESTGGETMITPAEAPTITLRLLETSDIHAYMLGYDYFQNESHANYGFSHTAAVIEAARKEHPQAVLIDNGDLIQGSPLGDYVAANGAAGLQSNPHPIIAALNAMNYDLANLGNHEFNFGLEFLRATYAAAEFPIISSNLAVLNRDDADYSWLSKNTVLTRELKDENGKSHRINIGFFGVLPPQIMVWDKQHLAGQVQVQDIVTSARENIEQLKQQGADIIVAVAHSGIDFKRRNTYGAEQAVYQLAGVTGIDAILFGHQHRVFPGDSRYDNIPWIDNKAGLIRGIPAVQPGAFGSHLGVIDLQLQRQAGRWQVMNNQVQVMPISTAENPVIKELVANTHADTKNYLQQPIGHTQQRLSNELARVQPTHGVQFVQQAQLWFAENLQQQGLIPQNLPLLSAAAPFRAGLGTNDSYTDIPAGELTLGDLADVYPYPNTLQVVKLSGAQVIEWLEMSAQAVQSGGSDSNLRGWVTQGFASYNFDTLYGLTYSIDTQAQPRYDYSGQLVAEHAGRVANVRFKGQPINKDQMFLVVTNNYRATGGGGFPELDGSLTVYEGTAEIRSILADYLKSLGEQGYNSQLNKFWEIK